VRIRKVQLLEPALQDHLFVQVVHACHGMVGVHGDAGHQESAEYKESSGSCAHECSIAKTVSRRVKRDGRSQPDSNNRPSRQQELRQFCTS
jgi:hypothetical protein